MAYKFSNVLILERVTLLGPMESWISFPRSLVMKAMCWHHRNRYSSPLSKSLHKENRSWIPANVCASLMLFAEPCYTVMESLELESLRFLAPRHPLPVLMGRWDTEGYGGSSMLWRICWEFLGIQVPDQPQTSPQGQGAPFGSWSTKNPKELCLADFNCVKKIGAKVEKRRKRWKHPAK